jgi:glycosyltransferase involved in cell wall biosynthesis
MKRALIISNKIRKIPGGAVETVVLPLQKRGFEVVWAANFSTLKVPLSSFPCATLNTQSETNPFSLNNLKTRRTILNYLSNNHIDLIFCSTPIGGLHGRLCGKKKGISTIIYEAHGFLFFKGGPKLGFFYKIIEKWLAHYTDALITINHEDYDSAQKFKIRNKENLFLVNGSGEDYSNVYIDSTEKERLISEIGIKKDDFVFVSIGELNKNKNVLATVKAFNDAFSKTPNCKLIICGEGKEEKSIKKYISKHALCNQVLLLGYRTDIKKILCVCNCYVSTSLREGLSRTVGEALASELPCIVSNKRGLKDWITDDIGMLFNPRCINDISRCMKIVYDTKGKKFNKRKMIEKVEEYSSKNVTKQFEDIFDRVLC